MPESSVSVALNETMLRERLNRFLSNHSDSKVALREALNRIRENGWNAVIFGGVLRDLTVFGNSEAPRDVDVVVRDTNARDLETVFRDLIQAKNRFGGLRLRPTGWLVDIWALSDTWAFRERLKEPISFETLVETTFLNVEAIAAEIPTQLGRPRPIYSAGFFESVSRRVLDTSFEPNPHPALCVVRSITTALRLNWRMSKRLAAYIIQHATKIPVAQLMAVQESHYGKIRIQPARMLEYLRAINDQLQTDSICEIALPATQSEQLEFSKYWTPVC
jgi:hypothetical protein